MDQEGLLSDAPKGALQQDGSATAAQSFTNSGTRRFNGVVITGAVLVVALIIAGLFLPPISIGQYLGLGEIVEVPEATTQQLSVPGEFEVALEGAASGVNVSSMTASDFEGAEEWTDAAASLPEGASLAGNVYVVTFDEPAPTAQVVATVPGNATATDLFRWDGRAWRFVPGQRADDAFAADAYTLSPAYAWLERAPQAALVAAEASATAELPGAIHPLLDEIIVGTLRLTEGNGLDGEVATLPDGDQIRLLRVTNSGAIVDQLALATLLEDEAAQSEQIEQLVDHAISNGLDGVALDYQGVDPDQRAAFTSFVTRLADALHEAELQLAVTLGTPTLAGDNRWDTGGQDWAALGQIADIVYLQMPLDPTAYADNGPAQQLLDYTVQRIDRSKLTMLLTVSPVTAAGKVYYELPHDQAISYFGAAELVEGEAAVNPGTAIEVALGGEATELAWEAEALTFKYGYNQAGQQHSVWLSSASSLAHRLRFAKTHQLRGVAISGLGGIPDEARYLAALESFLGEGDPPEPAAAAIVWTVEDEAGGVVASNTGSALNFAWQAAEAPGEYTIKAGVAQGDAVTELGAVQVAVAEPKPTPEPTEEPVVAVADEEEEEAEEPAPTPEPTAAPTAFGDAEAIVNIAANVRTGPSIGYPTVGDGLQQGSRVALIGRNADRTWMNIILPDGETEGWIFAQLIDINPEVDTAALPVVEVEPPAVASGGGGGSPAPAPAPAPAPIGNTGFELGGQTHTLANPTLMAHAGMTWVKFQHKWGPGDTPDAVAGRINQAHANGFKVLLSMPGSNVYPTSIDFNSYITFLGGVAALGPDAIEVWNEMNIDFEWPAGQIDPASYVNNMLAPAYRAIKAANPNVMVISGAPAPTGFDNGTNAWADNRYMAGMAAAGAANYMDCVGVHHNAGATSPHATSGHPAGGHYSWYFIPTMDVYYNAFGGARPVCFTELGYLSGEDFGGVPSRFNWASETSVAEHAQWLAEATSIAGNSGKVRMLIVFNVDFTHWSEDPQAGFAMVRPDGSCPSCETLRAVTGGR